MSRRMISAPSLPTMLRPSEAGRLMSVSTRTIQHLFDSGKLLGDRIGGNERRVYRSSVVRWLRENGVTLDRIHHSILCDVFLVGCPESLPKALDSLLDPDDFRVCSFRPGDKLMVKRSPMALVSCAGSVTRDEWDKMLESWPELTYSAVIRSEDGSGAIWSADDVFDSSVSHFLIASRLRRLV
jgi:excisionase family DNA binding protein